MSARSKPFQAATVKAATAALSGGNPLRRFLVADEVGLGKTVVARDTLAALASKARKFTVYYIASGLKVADQNKVELLRFLDKDEAKDALSTIDRVGLIPFEEKRKGKLRLYAFTPTTSFSSSQRLYGGKAVERAFIKLLLDELYPGLPEAFPEGYIEYGATSGWPWACEEAQGKFDNVSAHFKAAYGRALRTEFGKPARENILRAIETSRHGQSLGRIPKGARSSRLGFCHARPRDFRRVPMLSRTAQRRCGQPVGAATADGKGWSSAAADPSYVRHALSLLCGALGKRRRGRASCRIFRDYRVFGRDNRARGGRNPISPFRRSPAFDRSSAAQQPAGRRR